MTTTSTTPEDTTAAVATKHKVPVKGITKQSGKAIKALQDKHNSTEGDNHIHLVVSLKKIAAKAPLKPHRLALPHPFRRVESASVCLIVKDPLEKERERLPAMPCLQLVESVKTLGNKYKPFEAKRLLCASHDLFLADERVVQYLPKLLGKTFYEKKKQPISVNMLAKDLQGELKAAVECSQLFLNTGPCISIKVGSTKQPTAEIQANVEAVLQQIDRRIPEGGLGNVRALSVKTNSSIALPIYEAKVE